MVRKIGQFFALLAFSAFNCAAPGQLSVTIQNGKPEKPVVGLPYTAEQSIRTVQHLANGMPLTREIKGHMYRSADGVERCDAAIPSTDPANPDPTTMIYILDRTKLTGTLLNTKLKTATVTRFPVGSTVAVSFLALQSPAQYRQIKPEDVTTTDLGKQTQDMRELVGKRITGTIPAGKIGNDQPLHVVTEAWVSQQEKLIVKEVEQNPLSGERTFELTNIRSEEPDPALFEIPKGYTVKEQAPIPIPSTMPNFGTPPGQARPPAAAVPEQRTKQIEDALKSTDPGVKNNVAYGLAQNGDHLADAQLLVEQALPLREQQTADAVSGADPSKAFDQMILLSRFWDTAGYVYYRAHQPEKAEAYLRAAWELNPNCLFAIHLGFVYETEKKQPEATAIYRMGLSSKPAPVQLDELTTRLTKLGYSDAQPMPVDIAIPLPTLNLNLGPDDTEPLVDIALKHDSATIVTVVKGDSKLKKILAQAIQPALVSSLPDSGPEIILRRARVTCSASGTATCSLHFVTTGEYTAAEQLARRRAALPPLP